MFSRKPNLNTHIARVHKGWKMDLSFKDSAKAQGLKKKEALNSNLIQIGSAHVKSNNQFCVL